jgi:pimeloyl-ACP methyl ester carboxylesterase
LPPRTWTRFDPRFAKGTLDWSTPPFGPVVAWWSFGGAAQGFGEQVFVGSAIIFIMREEIWGAGPRVVLVHGAIINGAAAWSKQKPLADRWQLVVVNRPGFVPNPPERRCDFAADAVGIAELLDEPAHLVGHSYGGLIALLAASFRPESVRTLTVVEPPVMSLLRGDPDIERAIAGHLALLESQRSDPQAFLAAFTVNLGGDASSVPNPLPEQLHQHVELLMNERFPWEATIPTDALSAAPFPKLVISGGHDPTQEHMCDVLAEALGPSTQRAVIEGGGHNVQRTGAPFNTRLEQHFAAATPGRGER